MAMFDSATTRMPKGVTNAAPWQTLGSAGQPDPTWSHTYANDFDTYTAADWTVTAVGAGTATKTDFQGGAILLTTTTGATDSVGLQLTNAGFAVTPGRSLFYKFAGQLSDLLDTGYWGFVQKGATTLASITDGIFISKATSGSGALTLNVRKTAGTTFTAAFPATQVITAATYFELGIHVDYLGNVAGYFNPTTGPASISASAAASGQARGYEVALYAAGLGLSQTQTAPVVLPTVLMTLAFSFTNGSAAARTMTVDYVVAVNNR